MNRVRLESQVANRASLSHRKNQTQEKEFGVTVPSSADRDEALPRENRLYWLCRVAGWWCVGFIEATFRPGMVGDPIIIISKKNNHNGITELKPYLNNNDCLGLLEVMTSFNQTVYNMTYANEKITTKRKVLYS